MIELNPWLVLLNTALWDQKTIDWAQEQVGRAYADRLEKLDNSKPKPL